MPKNFKFVSETTNLQYLAPPNWQTNEGEKPTDKTKKTIPFVLIFGKDKDTRFLFKTACEIWDYDAAEADNCEQCFAIGTFKVPDLILFDSDIDFEESLEMMKKLQRSQVFNNCGFVFISGHAQTNVRQTALSSGADFFLLKPVDFALLENFLRNYFRDKNHLIPLK